MAKNEYMIYYLRIDKKYIRTSPVMAYQDDMVPSTIIDEWNNKVTDWIVSPYILDYFNTQLQEEDVAWLDAHAFVTDIMILSLPENAEGTKFFGVHKPCKVEHYDGWFTVTYFDVMSDPVIVEFENYEVVSVDTLFNKNIDID